MNDGRRRRARLAASAEADYRNILRWTAEHFGTQQARRYAETLQSAIEELIEGPDVPGSYTWRAVVDVERGSGNVFADLGAPTPTLTC